MYGEHPRIGISNLPILAQILQNLVTKAQLHGVYSSMNLDSEVLLSVDDAEAIADVLEEVTQSVAAGEGLVTTTPLVHPAAPGKHKVRSLQTSNAKTRETHDAKCTSLSTKLFQVPKPLSNKQVPFFPTPGKSCNEDLMHPSVHWLKLINEQTGPITLDKMRHASINSIIPIIYNTNNKDIADISHRAWLGIPTGIFKILIAF